LVIGVWILSFLVCVISNNCLCVTLGLLKEAAMSYFLISGVFYCSIML